jgi:hypothetical protein
MQRREGVLILAPSIPFPEREQGLQHVDLPGMGMALAWPGAVAVLQAQQRQFFPFQLWKLSILIYSFLSLERAMRGRSDFFP